MELLLFRRSFFPAILATASSSSLVRAMAGRPDPIFAGVESPVPDEL